MKESALRDLQWAFKVRIESEEVFKTFGNGSYTLYNIYTADGVRWENGLRWNGLRKELLQNKQKFEDIYESVMKRRNSK